MQGHVRKRTHKTKDGRVTVNWYVVIELPRDAEGKRRQKWYGSYRTRKEAEAARIEILHQINTGTWIEQAGLQGRFANGGFDLVPGVLDAIENGLAQWSIAQNPYAQGWVTSALIHMAIENGYPPFSYDTGAEVVDASNIGEVVEREAQFEG